MPAGQVWSTNSLGGFLYSDELSDVLRTEVRATNKFRQLADAQDFSDKGLHHGQLVTWNVYSKLDGTATTLAETTAMPETNFRVTQGTATVLEWGRAVPFTSLVDYFAKHSVNEVTRNALARDCRETLDRAAFAEFNKTALHYVGTATAAAGVLTTNGTATATNSSALNKFHVRALVDTMKERNIPAFSGDDYLAIARPTTYRTLRNELETVNQYVESGYGKILRGEIGRFEGVRFIEQSNIPRGVSASGATTIPNGTAWSSNVSDWCFFMGADTVAEVISVPPEVRGKIPSDYGRSLGMAWYALEGFGIIYNSTSDPSATNARIIKWNSAS
jgi:N4-gp56 family major capsid protein